MDDLQALWEKVIGESTMRSGALHGPTHWARVERNGIYLARQTGANELVVRLFALLHDCRRVNEGTDPGHGKRAAAYAAHIRSELPELSDEDFARLLFACEWHTDHIFSEDPATGICWDADRLDLGRTGVTPDPQFLNSEAAKKIALTGDHRALRHIPVRQV